MGEEQSADTTCKDSTKPSSHIVVPVTAGVPHPERPRWRARTLLSRLVHGRQRAGGGQGDDEEAPCPKPTRRPPWKQAVVRLLDSAPYQVFILALVFFTLFAADAAAYCGAPDGADPFLDAALLAAMAVFAAEVAAAAACRARPPWAALALDAAATASVAADLSWVAAALRGGGGGGGGGGAAAATASRAGRVVRLVRVLRVLRVATLAAGWLRAAADARRRRAGGAPAPAADDRLAPSNLGAALARAAAMQVALVVVGAVVATALLLAPGHSAPPLEPYLGVLQTAAAGGGGRAALQPYVDDMLGYARGAAPRHEPMELWVSAGAGGGEEFWSWVAAAGGYSRRSANTQTLETAAGAAPRVVLKLDATPAVRAEAVASMALMAAVVALLLAFVAGLGATLRRTLVAPLERIFGVIRANAAQVVAALGAEARGSGGGGGGGSDDGDDASVDGDMGTIEAAVAKMARIVALAGAGGGAPRGAAAARALTLAPDADGETVRWLAALAGEEEQENKDGGGGGGLGSPPRAPRGSVAAAPALTERQLAALAAVDVGALRSLAFDAHALRDDELAPALVALFLDAGVAGLGAPPPGAARGPPFTDAATAWRFAEAVGGLYRPNPYHNFRHCLDVCAAAAALARRLDGTPAALAPAEKLALLVAAAAHDADHPGVSNAFLVATRAPLAVTYNDASPLENRHAAAVFGLLAARPDADVLARLEPGAWRDARRAVIAAVLATDMAHHFAMVDRLGVHLELHGAELAAARRAARGVPAGAPPPACAAWAAPDDRALLLALLLHAADVSNPARPHAVAARWADAVLAEFFAQGDAEAAAGLPVSALCDRATTSRPGSQANFIDFVVAPLLAAAARLAPEAFSEPVANLAANRAAWAAAAAAEARADAAQPPEERAAEAARAEARLAAFRAKYKDVLDAAGAE